VFLFKTGIADVQVLPAEKSKLPGFELGTGLAFVALAACFVALINKNRIEIEGSKKKIRVITISCAFRFENSIKPEWCD
jgi:hypothetical protein